MTVNTLKIELTCNGRTLTMGPGEDIDPKIPNQLYICQPIASPKSSTISFWNAVIVV